MADAPGSGVLTGLAHRAHRLRRSRTGQGMARFGLASRALIYGTLALLTVRLSIGDAGHDTDQGASLQLLGRSAFGTVLLVLLAVGVVCFSLWRFSLAWLGHPGKRDDRRDRLQALVEGISYLPFGYLAVAVAVNDSKAANQGGHYRSLSSQVMSTDAGRWLVGAVGIVVVVVGGFLASQGVRRSFLGELELADCSGSTRRVVVALGVVGSIGRGVIFMIAGVLVVAAAVTADPDRAGGVDSALDLLARQAYGTWLLVLAALALASFAAFALAEARWRRT